MGEGGSDTIRGDNGSDTMTGGGNGVAAVAGDFLVKDLSDVVNDALQLLFIPIN